MIKVLFAAAEAAPFTQTDSPGSVVRGLPQALNKNKCEACVILPKYHDISGELTAGITQVTELTVELGWRKQPCTIEKAEYKGITYYFVGNNYYFNRQGIFGYDDDAERYAFFCQAVLSALPLLGFMPDIIHCDDWYTGLIPFILHKCYKDKESYSNIKTIYTIRGLKSQGNFPPAILGDILGFGWDEYHPDGIELGGQVSFAKAGIVYSDYITTVSPGFADEIIQPEYGGMLGGMLLKRQQVFKGILNGIDYDDYNANSDPNIVQNYTSRALRKRQENKLTLQDKLGLRQEAVPMLAMISSLTAVKGIDLIGQAVDDIMSKQVQLVIMGTGEAKYERMLETAAQRYKGSVAIITDTDDILARRICAGSDIFVQPGRYEPSGINAIMALRYGSIPLVYETGGLKDIVAAYNEETEEGNGFIFSDYSTHGLVDALARAVKVYQDNKVWAKIIRNAMKNDFSWRQAAADYSLIYHHLVD